MLKVEYLIFIDNESVKCNDEKTFNHLLQSNPELSIKSKKIIFKNISIDYHLTFGQIADTERTYFHLTFDYDDIGKIDEYVDLLKAIKSVIYIVSKSPQTLFDGVSIYFSNLAYPIVSDIENLMRKLITKFMLTKVGVDWIKDKTPEDVKISINSNNKDLTYLHNVDFIQLKNFLFSENYPIHKENLVKKLKEAKNINDLNLEDIKILIPNSNWERYFSNNLSISKEKLIKLWDELYDLRCKIAHNKSFNKSDFERVKNICEEIKPELQKAIDSLSSIQIDKSTREILKEEIANNFNSNYGEFISKWNVLARFVFKHSTNLLTEEDINTSKRTFLGDLRKMYRVGLINRTLFFKSKRLYSIHTEIVENSGNLTENEIKNGISELTDLLNEIKIIDNQLSEQ